MTNRFYDLIEQTFYFPQEGFHLQDGSLAFHKLQLMDLVKSYGTPLRISYLPIISTRIQQARKNFSWAFERHNYQGQYFYSYCTKSSHFSFILEKVLENQAHLELSSSFDIDLVQHLISKGLIDRDKLLICNGFKPRRYRQKIQELISQGFTHTIPVVDTKEELADYEDIGGEEVPIGLRMAIQQEPTFEFYTSRLGIRPEEVIDFYKQYIKDHPRFQLKMLHFFISSGIKDTVYYWSELNRFIDLYCQLKQTCPELRYLNIGGGLQIKQSLHFDYDYSYMIDEIVGQIQKGCHEANVPEPDIVTEFGTYTVGESGALLFSVLEQKLQNDRELWYMIDGSLMTTLPDIWGIRQQYILLPVNKWDQAYQRVNIGGLSCDEHDFYNPDKHRADVYLPELERSGEPLYFGFFHMGAYQEELNGFGGLKHCLLPSPQHLVIDFDPDGNLHHELFADEQQPKEMMQLLGY